MSQTVTLADDLDGTPATETLRFGLDGVSYEIDLNSANADSFRSYLDSFISAGRKIEVRRNGAVRVATKEERERNLKVRAWALSQGLQVSARGRISGDVYRAYDAGHASTVVPEPAIDDTAGEFEGSESIKTW